MLSAASPTIAASYERVSTLKQARRGRSLVAQARGDAEYAAAQGWELPERLRWVDTDSGRGWDLAGLQAMLESAQRREFRVLVVPDVDRFARDLRKALELEELLAEYGVRVVYRNLGEQDDSDESRFTRNLLHLVADHEGRKIKQRTRNGRNDKAREGKTVGNGFAPYGLRFVRAAVAHASEDGAPKFEVVGYEADEVKAWWVRRLYAELVRMSAGDVAAILQAEGAPLPRRAKRWHAKLVLRIAWNPVYKGTATYGRGRVFKKGVRCAWSERRGMLAGIPIGGDAVPAIVSEADWDRAQAALDARRNGARRGRAAAADEEWELRGLLACGHCGGELATDSQRHRRRRYRYYCCLRNEGAGRRGDVARCPLSLLKAEVLEAEAWRVLVGALADEAALAEHLDAVRRRYAGRDAVRADRERVLATQLAGQENILGAAALEKLRLGPNTADPRYAIYAQAEGEAARSVTQIRGELERLRAEPGAAPSARVLEGLLAYGARLRRAGDVATAAQRRALLVGARLRGRVVLDADGLANGRGARWAADWEAQIPLGGRGRGVGDSGTSFFKLVLLSATSPAPQEIHPFARCGAPAARTKPL